MKSIAEQIEELQKENEQLKDLKKLFEKAVKNEFGLSVKEIHGMIEKQGKKAADFE